MVSNFYITLNAYKLISFSCAYRIYMYIHFVNPGHKVPGQKVPNFGNIGHKVPDHKVPDLGNIGHKVCVVSDFLSGGFMVGDFMSYVAQIGDLLSGDLCPGTF